MIQQLEEMLQLQDAMNAKVNPQWRTQNFAWYRAIWTECAEMLDHFGWKWWKKQTPDREQVALELIDIWHFGLSILILKEVPVADISDRLQVGLEQGKSLGGGDFRDELEKFTLDVLESKAFDPTLFARLMAMIDLDFSELYRSYVGKNVLNFFRQDHGYQDGSYLKVWHGREDNEHLVEVIAECVTVEGLQQKIYDALLERYPK